MQVEIFCLCKEVPVDEFNRASLIGIFDNVSAGPGQTHGVLSSCKAVLSIRLYRDTDEGQHRFLFSCQDNSGKVLMGPLVDLLDHSNMLTESTCFFHVYGIPAGSLSVGTYWFSIEVDGKQFARIPLYVTRTQERVRFEI